jgi:hypothetical protein
MKSVKTRRLTVSEAKTLAAREDAVEDERLSRRLMDPVLVLQDGRAILMLRPRPLLYESVAELRQAVSEGEELMRRGPVHVASALPYGEEFAANAHELAPPAELRCDLTRGA